MVKKRGVFNAAPTLWRRALQPQYCITASEIQFEKLCRWWKDRDIRLALVGSGLIAFIFNNLDELAPIFVSAPVKQVGAAN